MSTLELGYELLAKLGIDKMYIRNNHLEIVYQNNNQAVIAFGSTQDEVVTNFYENYQLLKNPQ